MSGHHRVLAVLLSLAAATAAVALLGSPSQAEPRQLLVSGSPAGPFRDNLTTPLFHDAGRLVPRDEATSTFYVRNNSRQSARATLAVVNRGGTTAFEDALTVGVDIGGTTSSGTVPAVGGLGCSLVTTGASIAPGRVQAVDVTLAVADLEGRVGTDQAATLDFVVTLTQTGSDGQVEVCGEQATAQPEVMGEQDGQDGPGTPEQCRRQVVVTAVGTPTCVPLAVDAGAPGYGAGPARAPTTVAGLALLPLAAGAALVLLAAGRRRSRP